MTLLERFLAGDRVALARMISYVENRSPDYHEVLARIFAHRRGAYRVGITGPPGAGKSSIVNRLAYQLAQDGNTVAVIAVDPTSPFTGGAVLGDRVRMQSLYGLENVFVRSMATRGAPGGLAAATKDVSVLLEGFGFDIVLVETVGVGQVELDVASVCDTVVVVLVPESGDAIQAMKSGLTEIADIFCINKADRPGAERIEAELQSILDVKRDLRHITGSDDPAQPEGWSPVIIPTIAIKNEGIDQLWKAALAHRQFHDAADPDAQRRKRARSDLILSLSELMRTCLQAEILETGPFDQAVDDILNNRADPYTLSRRLFESWRSAEAKRPVKEG